MLPGNADDDDDDDGDGGDISSPMVESYVDLAKTVRKWLVSVIFSVRMLTQIHRTTSTPTQHCHYAG